MLRFIKDHNQKGQQAEALALHYLQQQGLQKLESNFSCKFGEIDLIMLDRDILVFIEVRYRNRTQFAHPLETINEAKQRKIIKTIHYFLMKRPEFTQHSCRIDAIAINSQVQSQQESIEWVKNAFQA
jgi:putative endonuclease